MLKPNQEEVAEKQVASPALKGATLDSLKKELTTLAIAFLAFIAGGFAMMGNLWPMSSVQETANYLFVGDPWGRHSTYEILMNDLDIVPYRHFATNSFDAASERQYAEVAIEGMRDRRDKPLVYVNRERRSPTATLIAGLTDTSSSYYGVLLLDPEGRTLRQWDVADDGASNGVEMHGLALLDDGSIIVAFNGGTTLARYDACGDQVWRKNIIAHHSVTTDGPDHVWTFDGEAMVRVEIETGDIVERIELRDLAESAPGKYILTTRKFFDRESGSYFDYDPFHPNDIEALPAEYASAFPMFREGDLMVSLRSGNLVFVVDRQTRQIVWWMSDGSFAQHDPDWLPDGRILIFDNNTDFGKSRIISIDPATHQYHTVLDGDELDFYTDLMGNQEMSADGTIMTSLSRQGRAVEYAEDGTVLFEFLNRYNEAKGHYGLVTEARRVSMEFVQKLPVCDRTSVARVRDRAFD